VLVKLRFQSRLQNPIFEIQWQQQYCWLDVEVWLTPDLKELLKYADYPEKGQVEWRVVFGSNWWKTKMVRCEVKALQSLI
jgi:hypothetical protein